MMILQSLFLNGEPEAKRQLATEASWEYLNVLNVCIQILVTTLLGLLFGYFGIMKPQTFVPQAIRFVFYIALPCLVLNALGINIDLYDDRHIWSYIAAFLILRVLALILATVWVCCFRGDHDHKSIGASNEDAVATSLTPTGMTDQNDDTRTCDKSTTKTTAAGQVAVLWLSMTWISTVIIGKPIAGAVFGNEQLGAKYGVLAAVSSFILQLPLQLVLLECHQLLVLRRPPTSSQTASHHLERAEQADKDGHCHISLDENEEESKTTLDEEEAIPSEFSNIGQLASIERFDSNYHEKSATTIQLLLQTDLWKRMAWQVIQNPVLWAIVGGFFLTLTTIGPRFLKDSSIPETEFVPGLAWIPQTLSWLGDCVTPVSLFTMGVWMSNFLKGGDGHVESMLQSEELESPNVDTTVKESTGELWTLIPLRQLLAFMVIKLVVVPAVMVGLAVALNLDDEAGRAAVLIASLPISMASFSLGHRYCIGESMLAANVVVGTLFVLPTVLAWNMLLDAWNLFPIAGA